MHQASGTPTGRQRECPSALPHTYCRARASGAATICRQCTPSPLLWARIPGLAAALCQRPLLVAAGGSSQRRSQRQQGKTLAAADKGKDCQHVTMPGELVQRVVEACVSWPKGQVGELEGVVWLLGGGMMQAMGST